MFHFIVSNVVVTSGVIIGLIVSSIIVFVTTVANNIFSFVTFVMDCLDTLGPNDTMIYMILAIASLMFAIMLKINDMLMDDMLKKIAHLIKENKMKTEKIEMLSRQIDSFGEKMNKTKIA